MDMSRLSADRKGLMGWERKGGHRAAEKRVWDAPGSRVAVLPVRQWQRRSPGRLQLPIMLLFPPLGGDICALASWAQSH